MNRRQFLWTAGTATAGLTAVGSASATADSHGTRFTYDGQQLRLTTAEAAVVKGRTAFAQGVPLRVRLRSDDASPFIKTTTTTVREGGHFRASFDLRDAPVGATVTATANWYQLPLAETTGRVVAADPSIELTYEGDRVTLAPAGGQTVAGTSALPAGEPLIVRLRASGDNPFIRSVETTVTDGGDFTATFDLSGIAPDTAVSVVVVYAGDQQATADGIVTK